MKALGVKISLLLSALLLCADATSILKPGDHLNSSWNLVSGGGNFTLGFFTARVTNYSYIGIWYTDDDQERQVWVANPNTPLINNSGALTIDSYGTLKIINGGGSTIFNISDHFGPTNTRAVLEDSGNFVLVDAVDNTTLWQSFDHPTNTLLPGMRLGYNRTSVKNWTLTSWLSDEVLGSGAFTLGLEDIQGTGQLVVRHRGELYWTSGPWNNYSFQYFYPDGVIWFDPIVSDSDGMYLTFDNNRTEIRMMRLSSMGEIEVVVTDNFSIIKYLCNGCNASERPTCRSPDDDFRLSTIVDFPHFIGTYGKDPNLSLGDCKLKCWKDCSCVAFAALYPNGTGCIIWATDGKDIINMHRINIEKYVLEHRVDTIPEAAKSKAWILPVLLVLGLLLLSVFIIVMSVLRDRKRRQREELLHQLTTLDGLNDEDEIENHGRKPHNLKIFSFGLITVATNNFSSENKLGEGGFGPVYKGKLLDGREIAVKRLAETSGQGIQEFKNELIFISRLQHNNLVRVLGCCIHQENKMLIYEFMPNKSLDLFLSAPERREQLDWQTRFNIMEGVAQGLLYLHKYARMRVIHRDLKASNVLLDENMHPKIADFGIARIFKQNEIEAITNRIVGTYGYMSPEYAIEGTFSIKSDVFSFGVLVLEIVSGKSNTGFYNLDRPLNLIGYAWHLWKEGNGIELKDPLLGDSSDTNQILKVIHIGLLCVQENAVDRPNMEDVLSMISSETMPSISPNQPPYFSGRNTLGSTVSEHKVIGNSI